MNCPSHRRRDPSLLKKVAKKVSNEEILKIGNIIPEEVCLFLHKLPAIAWVKGITNFHFHLQGEYRGVGETGEEQNNLPEQKMMQIILKYGMPICNPQGAGWL